MEKDILKLLKKPKGGLTFQQIASELRLSAREKFLMKKKLNKLVNEGVVLRIRRRYILQPKANIVRGTVVSTLQGYAFVKPEGNLEEDIFIPARYTREAMRGDRVEVLFIEKGKKGKPEGKVLKILEKKRKSILGLTVKRLGRIGVLPFDLTSKEEILPAGTKTASLPEGVVIELERESKKILRISGKPDDPGVDAQVVIQRFDLEKSFSQESLEEAESVPSEVAPQDILGHRDFRKWKTVTIDGATAQDFDDAVSVQKLKNGHYLLGVHIADVSFYVRPGTALDREAYKRGTSVYFPGLTLPMLPEKLSNFVCSLRPREEKLTFSVLLEIDSEGEILHREFSPSVIRTSERMTYDSVFRIFEGDEKEHSRYSDLVPSFFLMREVARLLRRKRLRQGSLDFDTAEPELIYVEGNLHSVIPFERNEAHQVIEEFMVAANEAVASYLHEKRCPVIFRVHPPPSREDLEKLREILSHFGFSLPSGRKIQSRDLQAVLEQVEGKTEEKFVNLQVLKSLRIATYSHKKEGHFGLAKELYTHFTSPIRRYPDLVVHRVLKKALRGERAEEEWLSEAARRSTERERRADEAERDLLEWRILRFLKTKLGEEMNGIIVDISKGGLVVEIENYFVDGVIPFHELGGDYYLRKTQKILVGRRTGKVFELGEGVKVILASVDPMQRRIGFALS